LTSQLLFGPDGIAALAADRLLPALLTSTLNTDIALERFLTMARRLMLEAAHGAAANHDIGPSLAFYSALARQCFINEYVFSCPDDETSKAAGLRDQLVTAIEARTPVPALWVLAVAAYFPLHALPLAARLLQAQWPEAVTAVLVQQICEPEEEAQLRPTIPRFTGIEDPISKLVRTHYEENPYPRWVKVGSTEPSNGIVRYLHHKFPLVSLQDTGRHKTTEVLIAGCGTGQHVIELVQKLKDASVLAVDLSLSSLCYAARKTRELGITSITYSQADIMELDSAGRSFDMIESAGVLHHLADPFAGWQKLLSLLRPGGFMMVGLYSEVARRSIAKAKKIVANMGLASTASQIRQGRQDLLDPRKNPDLESLTGWGDFYSISTCRDLLFHLQEKQMTLAGIDEYLKDNNLTFLGFEIDGDVLHSYRQCFRTDPAATDLQNWQLFENDNPDTFSGMYQFWLQKPV
jgi:2-polyprenyl-3-methyl-5-hydroxy-6-metoxy-1,4-benzoquinol methylase